MAKKDYTELAKDIVAHVVVKIMSLMFVIVLRVCDSF